MLSIINYVKVHEQNSYTNKQVYFQQEYDHVSGHT